MEKRNPSFRERVETLLLDMNIYPAKVKVLVPEILSLVRECVPDKRHLDYGGGGDIVWASAESEKNGWNACRQAILNEIGEGDA